MRLCCGIAFRSFGFPNGRRHMDHYWQAWLSAANKIGGNRPSSVTARKRNSAPSARKSVYHQIKQWREER
jgi:hypothetical protein